ncbi:MAG: RNA polymerase sigma factor [Planctomycetota bacterium]
MEGTTRTIRPEELLAEMGWVRQLARGLVADPALAEDLAQEAWIAASTRPPAALHGAGALRAWLATVVRNLARKSARSRGRREHHERTAAPPETAPSTADEVGAQDCDLRHGGILRTRASARRIDSRPEGTSSSGFPPLTASVREKTSAGSITIFSISTFATMKLPILITAAALALSPAGLSQSCVTTLFARDNAGGMGWATFFDVAAQQSTAVIALEINTASQPGTVGGVEVWTRTGTYSGFEGTASGWTLAARDDGGVVSVGVDQPTPVSLDAPILLPGSGATTGFAIVYLGLFPAYTNANTNQQFTDGNLTLDLGSVSDIPFAGGSVFEPRIFNGSLCTGSLDIGTNYCAAELNSTGRPGTLSATGSTVAADNAVTLEAADLPTGSFGFFLTSRMQGFTAMPGGSAGNLCLAGQIGRYVGAGQIQNSGSTGSYSLALDLTRTPTPTGLVAVAAGETWNFQGWHRDSVAGSPTSNFTDGLRIDFQ